MSPVPSAIHRKHHLQFDSQSPLAYRYSNKLTGKVDTRPTRWVALAKIDQGSLLVGVSNIFGRTHLAKSLAHPKRLVSLVKKHHNRVGLNGLIHNLNKWS